jgi:hypothetical protein
MMGKARRLSILSSKYLVAAVFLSLLFSLVCPFGHALAHELVVHDEGAHSILIQKRIKELKNRKAWASPMEKVLAAHLKGFYALSDPNQDPTQLPLLKAPFPVARVTVTRLNL